MLFNSLIFIFFFIIVFIAYWQLKDNLKVQNIFLLVVSAIFYGWWDYRFLLLLFISAGIDFYFGQKVYNATNPRARKFFIWSSVILNLGLLGYFKYLNFFIDSFVNMSNMVGLQPNIHTLNIILPVGISYYTFQSMSYAIDIYRQKLKPTDSFIEYMAFVCFFPQLVAGPIERASFLLGQFKRVKIFNYENAVDGLRLILYGFFKKIVIADNLALRVDPIFNNPGNYSSVEVLMGSLFFVMQLYGDLSGYADIARGTAKLLDFELSKNFQTPFFSTSVPETYRRWHITLTTWFRDYFFLPVVKMRIQLMIWKIGSTILLFMLIGFWHGADIKYLTFGFIIGLYFIPTLISKDYKWLKNTLTFLNKNYYMRPFSMLGTYLIFSLTSIFFRANSFPEVFIYFQNLVKPNAWSMDSFISDMLIAVLLFQAFEWIMRHRDHPFDVGHWHPYLRRFSYVVLIVLILLMGHFGETPFYYFQF